MKTQSIKTMQDVPPVCFSICNTEKSILSSIFKLQGDRGDESSPYNLVKQHEIDQSDLTTVQRTTERKVGAEEGAMGLKYPLSARG